MLTALSKQLRRLTTRVRSRREGRTGTTYTVVPSLEGLHLSWLTLENETGSVSLCWPEVREVVAFKRDLYAVDLICLTFGLASGRAVELHEEMHGWQAVLEGLPQYLPGSKPFPEWFHEVAVPAFAPNPTFVFRRSQEVAV